MEFPVHFDSVEDPVNKTSKCKSTCKQHALWRMIIYSSVHCCCFQKQLYYTYKLNEMYVNQLSQNDITQFS